MPRTAENQQLVFEEEILSDHSPSATRPEALGDIGQKVDDKSQYRLHSREDQRNGGADRKIACCPDFRTELAIRDPHVVSASKHFGGGPGRWHLDAIRSFFDRLCVRARVPADAGSDSPHWPWLYCWARYV
jgi:hypothetical protein